MTMIPVPVCRCTHAWLMHDAHGVCAVGDCPCSDEEVDYAAAEELLEESIAYVSAPLEPFETWADVARAQKERPMRSRPKPTTSPTITKALEFLDQVKAVLVEKNKAYGDSAGEPVAVFSSATPAERIRSRIDDKLSRLSRGGADDGEDAVLDLVGYLAILHALEAGE